VLLGGHHAPLAAGFRYCGGPPFFGGKAADEAAWALRLRPKKLVVQRSPRLRAVVTGLLREGWSPASVAGRLPIEAAEDQAAGCRMRRSCATRRRVIEWR